MTRLSCVLWMLVTIIQYDVFDGLLQNVCLRSMLVFYLVGCMRGSMVLLRVDGMFRWYGLCLFDVLFV
jgi:hypothetical protein